MFDLRASRLSQQERWFSITARRAQRKRSANHDRSENPRQGARQNSTWPAPQTGRGSSAASVVQEPSGLRLAVFSKAALNARAFSDCRLPTKRAGNRLRVKSPASRHHPPRGFTIPGAGASRSDNKSNPSPRGLPQPEATLWPPKRGQSAGRRPTAGKCPQKWEDLVSAQSL